MEVEVVAMSNMRPMGRGAAAAVGLSLVLAFSAPAATVPAPTPAWTTDVQMDVRTGSVAADRDGNSYVTGFRGTAAPIAVLEKFDPDGAVAWTVSWSPEGGRTHSSGGLVAVAPDGSVYLAGSVSSHYEGGGWFLRKYTPDGALVWARDERGWEHGRASDIPTGLAVSRRQIVLSGYWHGCCGDLNLRDGWVLAFGTDGSWRWKSRFEAPGREAFSDEAEGIALGAHGSIYVGGWVALGPESEQVLFPHALFLQELDRNGGVVWSRIYAATAHHGQDFGTSVAVHRRALIVSAVVDGPPVDWVRTRPGHAWLGRFTLDGILRWSRAWGTTWAAASRPTAVATGRTGRVFVTGTRHDPSDRGLNAFVRAYTSSGHLLWNVPLQEGHRRMVGDDVAWAAGDLFVTGEARQGWYGPGVQGYLWKFVDA
jgi:hypothetical protein